MSTRGHILLTDTEDPPGVQHESWLKPASATGQLVNKMAGWTRVVCTVSPGAAFGAPACFVPAKGEVMVDTNLCLAPGTDPAKVDVEDDLWRLENPRFMGVITHESGHVAHTKWTDKTFLDLGASPQAIDVITVLEEPRIEGLMLRSGNRRARIPLRTAATDLILEDFELSDTKYGMAAAAGLLLARVDAGVLRPKDVRPIQDRALDVLGPGLLGELQVLWKRFLIRKNYEFSLMLEIADEWCNLLPPDEGERVSSRMVLGENPSGGEKSGEMQRALGETAVQVESELIEARSNERNRRRISAAAASANRRSQGQKIHERVFAGGTINGDNDYARRELLFRRPPTVDEQRAATYLAEALEAAGAGSSEQDRSLRIDPPGRLVARAAVRAEALQQNNAEDAARQVEMFRGHAPVGGKGSQLIVALMIDVSGSMTEAAEPMASVQWVLSNAATRIGATVAAVHFGAVAYPSLRAHERAEDVAVYDCKDPWENFNDAFLSVDAEVQLLDAPDPAARLLVIASDARYGRAPQPVNAQSAMTMCKERGVAVLWLDATERHHTTYGHGSVVPITGLEPLQVAQLIGDAAVKELASSRR